MAFIKFPVNITLQHDHASIADGVRFECRFLDKSLKLDADQVSKTLDGNAVSISRARNTKWARLNVCPGQRPDDSCVIAFKIYFTTKSNSGVHVNPSYRLVLSRSLAPDVSQIALEKTSYTFVDDVAGRIVEASMLFSVPRSQSCNNENYTVLLDLPENSECVIYGAEASWVAATETNDLEPDRLFANISYIQNDALRQNGSIKILWSSPVVDERGGVSGWAIDLDGEPLEIFAVCGDWVSKQATFEKGNVEAVTFGECFYRLHIPIEHARSEAVCFLHLRKNGGETLLSHFLDLEAWRKGSAGLNNFLRNGDFLQWPFGLHVDVATRFHEVALGWHVDYRRGTTPKVTVTAAEIFNSGLKRGAFGARLSVSKQDKGGYLRLLGALSDAFKEPGDYFFSCGFQIPFYDALSNLSVTEIFLASVEKTAEGCIVKKIRSIKKLEPISRSLQLKNVRFGLSSPMVTAITAAGGACIAFELVGEGELIVFNPQVSISHSKQDQFEPAEGSFEDAHISEQAKKLKFSPIWSGAESIPAKSRKFQLSSGDFGKFVQIVIPVYNAPLYVENCVKSIVENTEHPFEIILSDDGSNSYTISRLQLLNERFNSVKILSGGANVGYTRNINQALQQTSSDIIVLMNSDTLVTKGWLNKLLAGISQSDDTCAVGPVSNAASWQSVPAVKVGGEWATNPLPSDMTVDDMGKLVEELSENAYPVFPILNGFCTMFRRDALEAAGYFSDGVFPFGYGEENDLCLRLGQLGYVLRVVDNCYVYHVKSKSFGPALRKELSRKSNILLRKRYLHINFDTLEQKMRSCNALSALRENLRNRLWTEKYPPMCVTGMEKA